MQGFFKIVTEDCVKVDDSLFFIARNINIIFKLEIKTGAITIVDSLPSESILGKRLGSKIISIDDKLFFSPMNAKGIWEYCIKDCTWKRYDIKKRMDYEGPFNFFQAVTYQNKIFFVGGLYPAISVLDTNTGEIEYIEGPYRDRAQLQKEIADGFFRTDAVLLGNTLYLASCINNEVLKINLDTYEYAYCSVGKKGFRYSGIDYDGLFFYLSPRKKQPVVKWDGKDSTIEINLPFSDTKDSLTTGGALCKDKKVIVWSSFSDDSFIIDNKDESEDASIYKERYLFCKKIDENTYVSLSTSGLMVIECNGTQYKYDLKIDRTKVADWLKKEMKNRNEELNVYSQNSKKFLEGDILDLGLLLKLL